LNRYLQIYGISASDLAKRIGFNPSTVRSLINGNRAITAETAVELERLLGIPRETLRPDLFVKRAA
jgi:plasmid maintenance system antidote protein VapI